jgi:hypothetical protein
MLLVPVWIRLGLVDDEHANHAIRTSLSGTARSV